MNLKISTNACAEAPGCRRAAEIHAIGTYTSCAGIIALDIGICTGVIGQQDEVVGCREDEQAFGQLSSKADWTVVIAPEFVFETV